MNYDSDGVESCDANSDEQNFMDKVDESVLHRAISEHSGHHFRVSMIPTPSH